MKTCKFIVVSLLFAAGTALAGTFINTNGSPHGIAISGYDTVAFFTEQNAVKGKPQHVFEWMGAKWLFSSDENLNLFKADPEKYAPQYGGNCALGVSRGYISKKPANGVFAIVDGKLYLFPAGRDNAYGAYYSWRRRGRRDRSIANGNENWPKLKAELVSR